ncbi:MAG: hypothetical protein NTX25_08190 [Proteobacteria bacterium]|nr:hypothetical protein [Pseudomonadota bacterium]
MKRLGIISTLLAVCFSCKHIRDQASTPRAQPVDRRILGAAVPLHKTLELDAKTFHDSLKYRRDQAWQILQELLHDVPVGSQLSEISQENQRLPIWQTWYESSEFQWMFDDLYNRLGPEGRIQFKDNAAQLFDGLPDGYDFCPSDLEKIFERQGNLDISRQFTAERFKQRLQKFKTKEEVRGVSGTGVTLFSPGLIYHYLQNYRQIFQCKASLAQLDPEQIVMPARTPCLASEFPKGDASLYAQKKLRLKSDCQLPQIDSSQEAIGTAVAVKTSWQLLDANAQLAVFDSSAAAMQKTLETGVWQPVDQVSSNSLSTEHIYTIETVSKLESGLKEKFQLSAIHFAVKYLEDWLWISLWWSPNPSTDFGADRPQTGVFHEGSPWSHYKMCVVSSFEEGSPHPGTEFSDLSLQKAVDTVFSKTSPHTWCANPFIERGQGNTRTNCIGCHQHAGTAIFPDDVFMDDANDPKNEQRRSRFPANGRKQLRNNFPGDYLWSFDNAPDFFQSKITRIIRDFKDEDTQK